MGSKVVRFLVWLLLVILWNFGVPEASPIYDVLMAIILSFITKLDFKQYAKFS